MADTKARRRPRKCAACGRFLTNTKSGDGAWECPSSFCANTGLAVSPEAHIDSNVDGYAHPRSGGST